MATFIREQAVMFRLLFVFCLWCSLVESCASDGAIPEVFKPKPEDGKPKAISNCQCKKEQCKSAGINFMVIQTPRSNCMFNLADLANSTLCPSGWQAAAIRSKAQLTGVVNCLLCGTHTDFASSLLKYPVLTSGRVWSLQHEDLPPRAALQESGIWTEFPLEEKNIDAKIPTEVSAFFADHHSDPTVPIPEGRYMVFLEGNREQRCESEDIETAGRYSTYHDWTLYSYDTKCADAAPDIYVLCQESRETPSSSTTALTTSTFPTSTSTTATTTSATSTITTTIKPSSKLPSTPYNSPPTTTITPTTEPGPTKLCCQLNDMCIDSGPAASTNQRREDNTWRHVPVPWSTFQPTAPLSQPISKSQSEDDVIRVCPGEEVVVACCTDYVGNITVTCEERTLALVTSSNTCTLAWIGEIHEMIVNGSYTGFEIACTINNNIVNKTLSLNDLAALSEELTALELLQLSQLEAVPVGEQRVEIALNYTQELVIVTSNLLSTTATWENLDDDEAAMVGPQYLASAERSGFLLADQVVMAPVTDSALQEVRSFNLTSPEISMVVTIANRFNDALLEFEYTSLSGRTNVHLPPGFAIDVADDGVDPLQIVTLFVLVRTSRRPLPGTRNKIPGGSRRDVNSEIASVSVGNPGQRVNFSSDHSVHLCFLYTDTEYGPAYQDLHHDQPPGEQPTHVINSARCVFWDTKDNVWSSEGCYMYLWQRDMSECRCNHLTMIAVITDVHNYVGRDKALDILGSVVVGCSLLSLLLAFTIFHLSRLRNLRVRITKQLCFALALSQLLMVLLLDPQLLHLPQKGCESAAIILHFTALSVIFWMLAEGVHLLQILRYDVEANNRHFFALFLFCSYGMAATIVTVTTVVAVSRTGSVVDAYAGPDSEYCWLNTEGGYIWAFTGPLVVVLVVNFVTQMLALHSASSLVISRRRSLPDKIKVWIKGSASLSAILGVTWVTGLLYMTTSHVLAYVFTVLTGSQGVFIFAFHCLSNATVMTAFLDSLPGKLSMMLSVIVKTTKDSRYSKQSPSVSPGSSVKRTRAPEGHVNDGFVTPPHDEDGTKARHKSVTADHSVTTCTCGDSNTAANEQKAPLGVRFSPSLASPLEQRDSPIDMNKYRRRSSEASGAPGAQS